MRIDVDKICSISAQLRSKLNNCSTTIEQKETRKIQLGLKFQELEYCSEERVSEGKGKEMLY